MNKELIDRVWKYCLPKEFKEKVKKYYCTLHEQYKNYDGLHFQNAKAKVQERIVTVEYFFGKHNLTSDTEGEEMLIVSRKRVQEMYAHYDKICNDPNRPKDYIESVYEYADGVTMALDDLFGSKCLPDEGTDCTPVEVAVAENAITSNVDSSHGNVESLEPKPAEPKFKEGNIVRYRYDGKLYIVVCKTGKYHYALRQYDCDIMIHDALESDLEPYTEPTANYLRSEGALNTAVLAGNYSSASTCDKQFDNIIKDGFKNHNRLHIAAMIMASMMQNAKWGDKYSHIARIALDATDALIAESEKGGDNGKV